MSPRRIFFGSTIRIIVTLLVTLGVVVGGGFAAGVFGIPGVVAMENSFGPVNQSTTTVETELVVHNPNPVGASFGDAEVDYRIGMNDIPMAHGAKAGIAIDSGNTSIPLETYLRNEQIPQWWVSHIRNDESTQMTIEAEVYSGTLNRSRTFTQQPAPIETDIAAQFDTNQTRPINASMPLVSDPVLYLNSTRGEWGDVSQSETPIEMQFTLYNPKSTPITMTRLGYNITMNDVDTGAGSSDKSVTIPPHSSQTVDATTVITNGKLDDWWVTHLQRNQVTEMQIDFYARVDVGGDAIRIPLRNVTNTIETDMFGNKPANGGSSNDSTSGDGGTDGESTTTTDGDSDTTATTTTTTTESGSDATTTTTTTTTSDDGGLLSRTGSVPLARA